MKKLLQHTKDFMEKADIKDRKRKGQYFTNKNIKDKSLKNVALKDDDEILENSCGTGEFLHSILERNENVTIDAFDIDNDLVSIVKKNFPLVNIKCANWLLDKSTKKYDKIIGNPPYFEISKQNCIKLGYSEYLKYCKSKPNIYSFFIAK